MSLWFDRADASSFLDLLYGQLDSGVVNLCKPAGEGLAVVHRASLAQADWKSKLLDKAAQTTSVVDLWVQFNPVIEGIQDPHRGTAEQTAVLVTLFADIDVGKKNTPVTTSDALAFLRSLPLPPTVIVASSDVPKGEPDDNLSSIHAYWALTEPIVLETHEERSEAKSIVEGWGRAINGYAARNEYTFDKVSEFNRVGRLPGSIYHDLKNRYNTDRQVRTLDNSGGRYQLADFEQYIPDDVTNANLGATEEGTDPLSEEAITAVRDVIVPFWVDGFRHPLALAVGGWLANNGVAIKSAIELVQACSEKAGDRKPTAKINAVENSYAKLRAGIRPSGWLVLKDILDKDALEVLDRTVNPQPKVSRATAGGSEGSGSSGSISLWDFASYLPDQKYIYLPTGKLWDPAGINRAFPSFNPKHKRSSEIDSANPIHDMTWAPGHPQIIEGAFLDQGGWLPKAGARVYNHYRPPLATGGDPRQATRWLVLLEQVYPEDAEHIVLWFAHRVQHPGEKLNHALVLGGTQGIGKDSLLEPMRHAVGAQNFGDVSPTMLTERFNAFLKNVVLRVSELRDLGDKDRYGFYEHTKTLIAAPPETLLVDEKNVRAYRVPNLVGVVFTTNHRTDGLYLPEDDRRHYVAWSELRPSDFGATFWPEFYAWLDGGGRDHVAAYLADVDLTGFDPKAPPPKTEAFWDIVAAGRAPEDGPLRDAIDKLDNPNALTVADIIRVVRDDYHFRTWLEDRRNSRQLPHRFEAVGYVATRSTGTKDGRWVIGGKRQTIYARQALSIRDRIGAAAERAKQTW